MITSEFICPSCGQQLAVRHSIKEKPAPVCPECKEPMVREITGGGGPIIVQGGKLSSGVEAKVSEKDRADMHHAKDIAAKIKSFAQPKTQEAFLKRESIAGETQPAKPGTRVNSENKPPKK